jgi:hypothetical protein
MIVGCDQDHPPEAELPDAMPKGILEGATAKPCGDKTDTVREIGELFQIWPHQVGSRFTAGDQKAGCPSAAGITISTNRPSVRYLTTLFTVALKHPLFAPPPVRPTALVSAQLCLRQLKTIYMPSEWYLPVHTGFLFHKLSQHRNQFNPWGDRLYEFFPVITLR